MNFCRPISKIIFLFLIITLSFSLPILVLASEIRMSQQDTKDNGNNPPSPLFNKGTIPLSPPLSKGDLGGFSKEKKNIKVKREGFTSSKICRNCHSEIYKSWSNSMHAASISDPVFEVSYLQAIKNKGENARKFCLSCHSPTTRITGDYFLKSDISKEGITCDFCHTITSVNLEKNLPEITNQVSSIIRGPFGNVASPAHGIEQSDLHTKSELCAGCHELKGENGVSILSTYSEWKESPYMKEGIQCQNCHMPELFNVPDVNPEVKVTKNFAKDHAVLGGHSQIKISKAATVSTQVKLKNSKVIVKTSVNNRESGHKIPTGTPARKIILEVSLADKNGKILATQSRTYQKVMVDDSGNILTESTDIFLKSARVLSDNRIAPKEVRKEQFEFPLPAGLIDFRVESTLKYVFQTPVISLQNMQVEMAKDVYVNDKGGFAEERVPSNIYVIIVAFVAGMFLTYLGYRIYEKYRR